MSKAGPAAPSGAAALPAGPEKPGQVNGNYQYFKTYTALVA